jgi:hypothetical protein
MPPYAPRYVRQVPIAVMKVTQASAAVERFALRKRHETTDAVRAALPLTRHPEALGA